MCFFGGSAEALGSGVCRWGVLGLTTLWVWFKVPVPLIEFSEFWVTLTEMEPIK